MRVSNKHVCVEQEILDFMNKNILPFLPRPTFFSRLVGKQRETEVLLKELECIYLDKRMRMPIEFANDI